MTVQVQQYGETPILMVTFEGHLSISVVNEMSVRCASLLASIDSPMVWRLVDLSHADVSFADVIDMIKHVDPQQAGGFADRHIQTIFCPPHPMAKLMVEMLAKEQYGNVQLQIFPGLGEALLYVQDEMDNALGAGV